MASVFYTDCRRWDLCSSRAVCAQQAVTSSSELYPNSNRLGLNKETRTLSVFLAACVSLVGASGYGQVVKDFPFQ